MLARASVLSDRPTRPIGDSKCRCFDLLSRVGASQTGMCRSSHRMQRNGTTSDGESNLEFALTSTSRLVLTNRCWQGRCWDRIVALQRHLQRWERDEGHRGVGWKEPLQPRQPVRPFHHRQRREPVRKHVEANVAGDLVPEDGKPDALGTWRVVLATKVCEGGEG